MTAETRRMLRAARTGAVSFAFLFTAGCFGGGDQPGAESGATAEEVDNESDATVTEQEQQAFTAPADSALTPAQVEAYLKVALLQFDLVRQEAGTMHEQAKRIEDRGKSGGLIAGLRNTADAVGMMSRFTNVVGGSYVRAARTLKYNPAEMEWVRERMSEVGLYLTITKPGSAAMTGMAQQMRTQATDLRAQLAAGTLQGYTEEDVKNIENQAAEMEANLTAQTGGAAGRNAEVLHQARSNVTEKAWGQVALAGQMQAWAALAGMGQGQDTTVQRQIGEWRTLYTDVLANRVTPGTEPDPAPATN